MSDDIEVTVNPSGTVLTVRPGEALLDGMRRNGYSHRHGCRRGGCGQCKLDLLSGEVEYESVVAESVLSAEDRAAGTALSCRALARRGPIVVALRDETIRRFAPWVTSAARSGSTPTTT
ncbi:2Fe-2S iron-sulfur cluster-binding protein [Amycolatopsis pithecellobii]|uniref:2Fe-2S iron-sulfur cluster binding domain-containing protein n=1 Tax=Amycolatopsis pithecellobii TaxID=664692 RepID=A0A6N7Z2V5_9PSEU|nr:2Fe-2S iron-sulfur cluster-binding protein [Amycolatopsis pithecellobii]MTD54441.1 2Fe-2S iron-sulfur cluster binding domain-containing protein [Amycolatopsis pithecellobii]